MNNPMSVKNFSAPMAAPLVSVGRMIEQTWELSVQEYGGLRHDQVGVEVFAIKWRRVQVRPILNFR